MSVDKETLKGLMKLLHRLISASVAEKRVYLSADAVRER